MDVLRSPSKNNMSNIRDLFSVVRDTKDRVPPDLKPALTLLRLNGLQDLEERFLSTDAFLKPWSVFRDSVLLLSPEAIPHATQIRGAGPGISRLELLWFYTHFDEDGLRYDPRADRYNEDYTPDTAVHGMIEKGKWRVEDYEKHLYAWLLQEFKVGKAYSPWRFECFELKNICTVWEDVFVPIVNAVRASYDRKGRRYYGRLALFIESRCPSRLAFPDVNIRTPEEGALSSTPYRVVSMPKRMVDASAETSRMSHSHRAANGVLSKKHYDEAEKELRSVYPQYGGLVERPRFKQKMDEWLTEQRVRADRRKEQHQRHGEVQASKPQVFQQYGSRSTSNHLPDSPSGSLHQHACEASKKEGGGSPIKQFTDSIKRSFSRKEVEQKSALHGVTRQLHFSDSSASKSDNSARSSMIIKPLPRPDPQRRTTSELSVYASVRNSNPFTEDAQNAMNVRERVNTAESVYPPQHQRTRSNTDDSVFSPIVQLSAIPRPQWPIPEPCLLEPKPDVHNGDTVLDRLPAIQPKKSFYDTRLPSYEGTAYRDEISLTDLHNQRLQASRSPESTRSAKLATRLPGPVVPIPYGGARVASADKQRTNDLLSQVISSSPKKPLLDFDKPVVLPPTENVRPIAEPVKPKKANRPQPSPPKTTAWPGFESDEEDAPPVRPKSPDFSNISCIPGQLRNPRSRQFMREDREHDMSRIVSKENIRAALGNLSRENSAEDLTLSKAFTAPPPRSLSSITKQLQTYNTHLFPRKREGRGPSTERLSKDKVNEARIEPDGAFELGVLKIERKQG